MAKSLKRTGPVNDLGGVAAVILAAGGSTRMGRPKQLLEFDGQTLLGRAASAALDAGCQPVVVVTGAHAVISRKALGRLDILEAENPQWKSGMSSSVRVGIQAVMTANPQTAAIVLMLCDQPFVTREVIGALVATHLETGRSIVASSYGGSCGVPALFGKSHFAELRALEGAAGAKQIIEKHRQEIHLLPFPKGEIDVDTPDDFARLQSNRGSDLR